MSADDQNTATEKALEALAGMANALVPLGGPFALGGVSAGALLRTIARAIRDRGESVDELLVKIRAPRALKLPWNESAEEQDTSPERPSVRPPK